jgi:hypothetical protein
MVQANEVLNHVTLTSAVNEMKAPLNFIKNTVFGNDVTVPTRHIELSIMRRGRMVAPLVKRDGAAIMTTGRSDEFIMVMPAHARTKRPMSPSDLLEKRRAGGVIHLDGTDQSAMVQQYIGDELKMQMDDHQNLEEYLSCLALRGSFTYSAADDVEISVDYQRPAAHDVVLGGTDVWDNAASNPVADIDSTSALTEAEVGLNVTDAYMGSTAGAAFLKNEQVRKDLDTRRLITGQIDLTSQIDQNGARFIGTLSSGVRLWIYSRKVTLHSQAGGATVDLIRPKFVEFVCNTPEAEFVTYYGAIEDMKAIGEGNVLQSKRFSKSWEVEDPSARMLLVESNPLPVMRRPGATVSMQVVA